MSAVTGLLLVEPAAFGFNAETAADMVVKQARAEFAGLVEALRGARIPVAVASDSASPVKPDAVFPNNWVSFHADGTLVLYPMRDPTRRAERREAVIETAKAVLGFRETRRIDLTSSEQHGRFLEGTGSLVLDHRMRVAYACRSPRTDERLVHEWAAQLGYAPFLFDATTADGTPAMFSPSHSSTLVWYTAVPSALLASNRYGS
jgi:hypothetical protein